MSYAVTPKRLGILLIILMLANSSMALDILAHSGMASPVVTATMHHGEFSGIAHTTHSDGHQVHDQQTLINTEQECLCDDICCISSVNILDISSASLSHRTSTELVIQPLLYQSIDLDLLRPPPNR